jgi:hypothetical protein
LRLVQTGSSSSPRHVEQNLEQLYPACVRIPRFCSRSDDIAGEHTARKLAEALKRRGVAESLLEEALAEVQHAT